MPVLAMSAGKVTAIWGNAYVRQPDGSMKALQVGDKVLGGTRIITEDDGLVEISPTFGPAVVLSEKAASQAVDKAIAGIEAQDPEQVPAAGLDGGVEGSLRPGLRVDRVNEAGGQAGVYRFAPPGEGDGGSFGSSADQRLLPTAEEPELPGISINDVDFNEAAGTATFTVTLDQPSTQVVTVVYATGDETDTASPSGDYTAIGGQLRFEPGQTSLTLSVPILNETEPGLFEGDAQGEGRERFLVKLSEPAGAVIVKALGEAVIRDDGTGSMPSGGTPDDDRPLVESVEVVASDNDYVYFGVRLSNPSELPVLLKLELSPGDEASTSEDAWTGDIEYSLDAMDGMNENITFMPWRQPPASGNEQVNVTPDPLAAGNSVALVTLPPLTPTGLILLKVPLFMQADPNRPHVDAIKLSASTQYDDVDSPKSAELPLLHGGISSGTPVMEGEYAVFDLMLTQALAEDLKLKLTLHDGVNDPATPENERALLGFDTGTQLSYLSGSGGWVPLSDDGVLLIEKGSLGAKVRVATINDEIPEDLEHIRVSATGVLGDVALTGLLVGHAAIRDNDDDIDPIRSERIASFDDGVIPLALAASLPGDERTFVTAGLSTTPGSGMGAALDMRDLVLEASDLGPTLSLPPPLSTTASGQSDKSDVVVSDPLETVMLDLGMFVAQSVIEVSGHAKLLIETA